MIPREIEAVALLGWHVYPCSRSSRAGAFKGAHLAATYDLDQLSRWCAEFASPNWRLVLGPSSLWGLDVDAAGPTHSADGIAAMRALIAVHGPLPDRPTTRSGGGGYAIFFRHGSEKIVGKTGVPAPGIDPRRGQLSVTIPPSVHTVTGRQYRWLIAPWEVAPPPAPPWLLRLVAPPPEPEVRRAPIDTTDAARQRLYRAANAVAAATPGQRNDILNRRAYEVGHMIGAGLLGEREGVEALYGAARQAGLPHPEARATIVSGINSGIRRASHG